MSEDVETVRVRLPDEPYSEAEAHWMAAVQFSIGGRYQEIVAIFWSALQNHASFEIVLDSGSVSFFFTAAAQESAAIRSQIAMILPEAVMEVVPDYCEEWRKLIEAESSPFVSYELSNKTFQAAPYWNYLDRSIDLLAPAMNLLSMLPSDRKLVYQVLARPLRSSFQLHASLQCSALAWKLCSSLKPRLWFWPARWREFNRVHERSKRMLFGANMRFCLIGQDTSDAHTETQAQIEREADGFLRCLNIIARSDLGGYRIRKVGRDPSSFDRFIDRAYVRPFILSDLDLTTAFHILALGGSPFFTALSTRRIAPPLDFIRQHSPVSHDTRKHDTRKDSSEETVSFETVHGHGHLVRLTLNGLPGSQHFHVLGRSGMGKTSLLQLLLQEDMNTNRHAVVFDCSQEFVRDLPGRSNSNVAALKVRDGIQGVGLSMNPTGEVTLHRIEQIARKLSQLLVRLSCEGQLREKTAHALSQTISFLLTIGEDSFSTLHLFLSDDDFRARCFSRQPVSGSQSVSDLAEFTRECCRNEELKRNIEALSNIRLNPADMHGKSSNGCAASSSFSDYIRTFFECSRVLVVHCPKLFLGSRMMKIVAALLTFSVVQRVLMRDEYCRLIFDEFQEFSSPTLCELITEKSGRVCFALAHQSLAQLQPETLERLERVSMHRICFQLSGYDAERAVHRFQSSLEARDFTQLAPRDFQMLTNDQDGPNVVLSGRTSDYPQISLSAPSLESKRDVKPYQGSESTTLVRHVD